MANQRIEPMTPRGSSPIAEELNLIAHLVPRPCVHDAEQASKLFANRKPLLLADNDPSVATACLQKVAVQLAKVLGVEGVDHPSCIPSPEQLLLVGVFLISDFKNSGDIDMADTQRADQIRVATVLVEIKRESLQGPLRGFLREFRAKTVVVRLLLGE